MISVSKKFKDAKRRNFYITAQCTLSDNTVLDLKREDFYISGNSIVDSSDSSDFPLGCAIEKTATLSLVNDDDRFSEYNFNAARFALTLNLDFDDGTSEKIRKGTFVVLKKPATAGRISMTLADRMYYADRTYTTKLLFPTTAGEVLQDCCQTCGIMLGDATFTNDDFVINEAPSNTTHRAVIGYIAMLAGGNARIDEEDRLRIIQFPKEVFANDAYDGGTFRPWTTGETIDGGTFSPWTTGTVIDGGTFAQMNDYLLLYKIKGLQVDTDDVVVTGVKASEGETEYSYGADGYVVKIENPLIAGKEQQAVDLIGAQIVGLTMRPFSCDHVAEPTATFLDPVYVVDVKQNVYQSYLTNVEFAFNGNTKLSNTAKSAEEEAIEQYSGNSTAVEQAKKAAKNAVDQYDVAVRNMNELAANLFGYYTTTVTGADGSIIDYWHDKPNLSESKTVYKKGIDGFFVTQDYQGTDEATSTAGKWKAGFTSNGDATLNILYAIGIVAEWINTRGLTARDNDDNITFQIDPATGAVRIVASSFSLISGKTIDSIAEEKANGALNGAKSYADTAASDAVNDFVSKTYNSQIEELQKQLDGQIESFYYDYEPTTSNVPASNWKTDADKQKHEGDLFYWKSKGYAYRFLKDGTTWKWQVIQDTDITKAIADAAAAKDTADHKRRVFVSTPVPPYDVGDLWTQGVNGDIMRCQTAKSSSQSYSANDWVKASKYTDDSALTEFIKGEFATLSEQADKKAETFYQNTDPSIGWTNTQKTEHKGDIWYNTSSKKTYIYSGSAWEESTSEVPQEVFDKIDGKAQVFVSTPTVPYHKGDLWFANTSSDVKVCVTERLTGSYNSSDWQKRDRYVDSATATTAGTNAANTAINNMTQTQVLNKLTNGGVDNAIYLLNGKLYISFSAMRGEELTLGGANNVNGILVVLDGSGSEVGRFDRNGATLTGSLTLTMLGYTSSGKIIGQLSEFSITDKTGALNGLVSQQSVRGLRIYGQGNTYNESLYLVPCTKTGVSGRSASGILSSGDLVLAAEMDGKSGPSTLELTDYDAGLRHLDASGNGYRLSLSSSEVYVSYSSASGANTLFRAKGSLTSGGGTATFNGYLTCTGGKSRLVDTENYGQRLLYCYEMPSPMFGDIGEAVLDENGECCICLDDIFSETIVAQIEYQVFLQKEGAGDVWVNSKEPAFFVVKGTPGLKFAWEIKAKQLDYEYERLERYGGDDIENVTVVNYEQQYMRSIETAYENQYITQMETALQMQEGAYL